MAITTIGTGLPEAAVTAAPTAKDATKIATDTMLMPDVPSGSGCIREVTVMLLAVGVR